MDDAWGAPIAASSPTSVDAWNTAWDDALHFVNDPFVTLADANENDDEFVLGSVFCGTYRLLGGLPATAPEVVVDLQRAEQRASSPRERAHVDAMKTFAAGDFTDAANKWDQINRKHRDFAAVRFAHDAYLHVGNSDDRLASSATAVGMFEGDNGWNFVASQYAFALEESGHFEEAERVAFQALDADPRDVWASHALAHVYEHVGTERQGLDFLRSCQADWEHQDGLSVHVWWHLTLRLIALGEFDEALAIFDELVPTATTPFRLCDLTSMLWRLELAGGSVGDRWGPMADALAGRPELHTNGFLDLHAALAYTRIPDHPAAAPFFAGVETAHAEGDSEIANIFRATVVPLVSAVRNGGAEPAQAVAQLDSIGYTLQHIGGSNAQREIVDLTRAHFETRTNPDSDPAPEAT